MPYHSMLKPLYADGLAAGSVVGGGRVRLAVSADLRSTLDAALTYGAVAASVTATLLAVFTPEAPGRPGRRTASQQVASSDDGFRWAIMGVISCLPLFSWLAWVFGALDDDDKARTYYWLAALYALPLLRSGFEFDWFTLALLVAGVVHVQAERIAATEPETQAAIARQLRPLAVVRTVASTTAAAASSALGIGGAAAAAQRQLPPGAARRGWWEDGRASGSEEESARSDAEEYELQRFDSELRDRERRRRQQRSK